MWRVVYDLFVLCEATSTGQMIRDSVWLFPAIEAFHLLALSVMGGMILAVDLRLLGLGLKRHPLPHLARDVQPWLMASLAVMLLSGFLLFLSEPLKCWDNGAFGLKMEFLLAALLFTFTVRRWYTQRDESRFHPRFARTIAAVSLILWTGVGIGGRGIGFY
jgi:Family of unknown function (DUF6644)